MSPATRARVMAAARELGYRPNALARAMISGRSGMIAVVVAYLDNHFYPVVLEQLSRALQARGLHTLLFMTEPGDQDSVVQEMLQYQVEGVVLASATLSSRLARTCAQAGIPVVMFNRSVRDSAASSVTSDNRDGGAQLADFLVAAGHRRIAFIAGAEDSSTSRDREAGFVAGLARHRLTLTARAVGSYTFAGGAQAARDLLDRPRGARSAGRRASPRPSGRLDAIFVANDHMAIAAMDVIRGELGLRIPQDLSIVGYDDVPEANWVGYRLTTVRQPAQEMITQTVAILCEQIQNRSVNTRAIVLPVDLVVRESARLPPADAP